MDVLHAQRAQLAARERDGRERSAENECLHVKPTQTHLPSRILLCSR
jgi:hypothetical protein